MMAPSPRRDALLDFVGSLSPTLESSGGFDVPPPVLSAIRQTVANLLGTLPPQFFHIKISARSDNLAQLMFSVLMTGYMFCNGWYRLQLLQSMGSLPTSTAAKENTNSNTALIGSKSLSSMDEDFTTTTTTLLPKKRLAAGAQKLRVEGEVLRWDHDEGVQQVSALTYIEQLEEELETLQRQLEAAAAERVSKSVIHDSHNNELLEFLKNLSADQVSELTDCATPDVLEAMNSLVRRLIGEDGQDGEWGKGKTECTASELATLLCWLMSVGHQLRTMEVRLSLIASLDSNNGGNQIGPDDGADGPSAGWVPRLPPGR